jgi:hypothetical protein
MASNLRHHQRAERGHHITACCYGLTASTRLSRDLDVPQGPESIRGRHSFGIHPDIHSITLQSWISNVLSRN